MKTVASDNIAAAVERMLSPAVRGEMRTWRKRSSIDKIKDEVNRLKVNEWAEKKRILPPDLTSMPGPFRFDQTPWLIEPCEMVSDSSEVKQIDIMKASRGGWTVGFGENLFGYKIDVSPDSIIYATADEETAKMVMKIRIRRMIQLSGLEHKVFAQAKMKKSRDTGSTDTLLQFVGGRLEAMGPNSEAKTRDRSAKILYFDEVENAPLELRGNGSPLAALETRTKEFWDRKIIHSSTPKVRQTSHIEPLYLAGDQRHYFFHCPYCDHFQTLKWGKDHLIYETDERGNLKPESVYYRCEKNGCRIKEEDKYKMLQYKGHGGTAEWVPTAVPDEPGHISYFWPGWYSLFYTWVDVCREWIKAQGDPRLLQIFWNTTGGGTWEERGEAPPAQEIASRAEGWQCERIGDSGKVLYSPGPFDGLSLVTMGVDVQADRLEAEVVGWGRDKESWSLGYHVLPGDTSDPRGKAWSALQEIIMSTHAHKVIDLATIDTGFRPDSVYQFADRFSSGVLPVKGTENLWNGRAVFQLRNVVGYSVQRADLNDWILKSEVYSLLRSGDRSLPGFAHFPEDYPDKYYEMLTAEEYRQVRGKNGKPKMTWDAGSRRNEAFDCRVYALGALYVLAHDYCGRSGLEAIDWAFFWDNHA